MLLELEQTAQCALDILTPFIQTKLQVEISISEDENNIATITAFHPSLHKTLSTSFPSIAINCEDQRGSKAEIRHIGQYVPLFYQALKTQLFAVLNHKLSDAQPLLQQNISILTWLSQGPELTYESLLSWIDDHLNKLIHPSFFLIKSYLMFHLHKAHFEIWYHYARLTTHSAIFKIKTRLSTDMLDRLQDYIAYQVSKIFELSPANNLPGIYYTEFADKAEKTGFQAAADKLMENNPSPLWIKPIFNSEDLEWRDSEQWTLINQKVIETLAPK